MHEIEALETLDEFKDDTYSSFLEYTDLKSRSVRDPTVLYIQEGHEFLAEWTYFGQTDRLLIVETKGETKIC